MTAPSVFAVRARIALAMLVLTTMAAPIAAQVLLQEPVNAQGMLRGRGRECFVLTPFDRVSGLGGSVIVIGPQGNSAQAQLERELPGGLGLLRVSDGARLGCEDWLPVETYTAPPPRGNGQLQVRDPEGALLRVQVTFAGVDEEFLSIRSASGADSLTPSMLGARLMIDGAVAGILTSLDAAEGRVLKLDGVYRRSASSFAVSAPASARPALMDAGAAQATLGRAVALRDGSSIGQQAALQALLARNYTFDGAEWSGLNLSGASMVKGSFKRAVMHGIDLTNVKAAEADFTDADLRVGRIERAEMVGVTFTSGYAPFLDGGRAQLQRANLSGSNFFGADFRGARFDNARLNGTSFAFADLRGAVFDGADLTGAYLSGAVMDATTTFTGSVIRGTNFEGAAAADVVLTSGQLGGACRHVRRGPVDTENNGLIQIWIDVIEVWSHGSARGGFESELMVKIRATGRYFNNLSLSPCVNSAEAADAFDAEHPGSVSFRLNREFLDVANRRAAVSQRIDAQVDLWRQHLRPERMIKGSAAR